MNARIIEQHRVANESAAEIREYLHEVRRQLDELWRAARDATSTSPVGTREINREIADNAAHELLQCLALAEDLIDHAPHACNELEALDPSDPQKMNLPRGPERKESP